MQPLGNWQKHLVERSHMFAVCFHQKLYFVMGNALRYARKIVNLVDCVCSCCLLCELLFSQTNKMIIVTTSVDEYCQMMSEIEEKVCTVLMYGICKSQKFIPCCQ